MLNNNKHFQLCNLTGVQLHLSAVAQIMSSMPETRSFNWIDWSGIATKFIRVQKPTTGHPLNYVWPSDACSLLVIDNAMVTVSTHHAQSCHATGVFIVINPDTATRRLLRSFCFLSLQFQPNNPGFPDTSIIYGQVYACFLTKAVQARHPTKVFPSTFILTGMTL